MPRWWPLALLLCVLTALTSSRQASASTDVRPENRVRGFDLVAPVLVGMHLPRTAEKDRENRGAYDEIAPGYSLAAEGVPAAGGEASTLAGDSYQILDGVRRAKAAAELGLDSIAAEVQIGGSTVKSGQVPISSLLSPKSLIDLSSPSAMQRWLSVVNGTQAGDALPPIIIQPGTTGIPITGVGFGF